MTELPTPPIKADPRRPYKMYAAIASAFLTSFLATNATDLPAWAVGLLTALVAALAVFLTPNPIIHDDGGYAGRHLRDEAGESWIGLVIGVLLVLILLVVLFRLL